MPSVMPYRRVVLSVLVVALSLMGLLCRPSSASAATVSAGAATASPAAGQPGQVHATVASATGAPQPVYGNRYWLASPTGAVWPLGGAPDYGSLAGDKLARPIVGINTTADTKGYWMVAGDGGVFSFGDARFYGSTGGIKLDKPVIGLTSTPDGKGYWMYAADGGIFSFGDARFYGSTGGVKLARPIVGMAATPDGKGYWLFAADGGIFNFGDARFYGSTGGDRLAAPVVSMAATPDDKGYWLMASDGGVFNFGDAKLYGSLSQTGQSVARIVPVHFGGGYWEITHAGDVYPFGTATQYSVPEVALFHTILTPGDKAMEWAMAQIGKPYQWGGTGPASFDCSGLVMRAWQSVGVNIPRVAADQYGFGTHVTLSQLQMGDLVFWASNTAQPTTIYHVAMYIGGEHIVEAPYTGQLVQTNWDGGSDFVGMGTAP
ncbi:MAG TPA: C40 family peptidase [Acidimicrobiales bacterium]|jgi:cell wall-associated NlpC family hydrolase|nr:C40 family peptidase [Acidimicrobiales bacterium]